MTAEEISEKRYRCSINDVFGPGEVEKLLDEREVLLAALKKVPHPWNCASLDEHEGPTPPCDCGIGTAIAKAEEEVK